MHKHEKYLLTYEEAAAAMGWSLDTLRRKLKAGEIPVVEDNGSNRIDPEDLRKWVAAKKVTR